MLNLISKEIKRTIADFLDLKSRRIFACVVSNYKLELCIGQEFVMHETKRSCHFLTHTVTMYEIVNRSSTYYYFCKRNSKKVSDSSVYGYHYTVFAFASGFISCELLICSKNVWHENAKKPAIYQLHFEKMYNNRHRIISKSGMRLTTDYSGTAYATTYSVR